MLQPSTIANSLNRLAQRDSFMDATTQKLQSAASGNLSKEEAKKVAKEFESLFVSQMMEHMMSGESMGETLFGNAETDEIYKSMMIDEYSKAIVKGGGIGIAKYIENSLAQRGLLQAQEVV